MLIPRILFCFVCVAVIVEVAAHRQQEAYRTVLVNQRTGNMEISHRFSLHDAEHVLSQLWEKKSDILSSEQSQMDFARYVYSKFQLKNSQGVLLNLDPVGFELEGQFFWVYQEAPIPAELETVSIKMEALQEVWPDHVNQVNVEWSGHTRAVRLSAGDGWQGLALRE